ncbi:MAG: glycosyltransferase [Candidatus Paceibacterota bacterium]|jgi:cellulose synthase/poly-beta-1,6-N-acetylglucosamine synthase-like glycosyltransferase
MKLSLLVPCFNEEKSIQACIQSCLSQVRKFDEIIFIDDCSTDGTSAILASYSGEGLIIAKRTPQNTGNKSTAQEFGLQFVTGDVVVTTDADTVLDSHFTEEIERSFISEEVVAVAGHVKSLDYNWLTLCRAFDYVVGQHINKLAQSYVNYIFVMPGAASAFRTELFRKYIGFDHDTITEDLDFTYKLHWENFKIIYNDKAISYTEDPTTLSNYVNQIRRWFGGGWQNLIKHFDIAFTSPIRAFELSLIYTEGLIFSLLVFILPIINILFTLWILIIYFAVTSVFGIWAAWKENRPMLALVAFPYVALLYINAYIYLEQFIKIVVFRNKDLIWFKPDRIGINPQ